MNAIFFCLLCGCSAATAALQYLRILEIAAAPRTAHVLHCRQETSLTLLGGSESKSALARDRFNVRQNSAGKCRVERSHRIALAHQGRIQSTTLT